MISPMSPGTKRVLIVEDEPVSLRMLQHMLTKQGYAVDVALDGNDAISKISGYDYHGVVTDWLMPGLDGIEVVRHLRARPGPGPIVVLISVLNLPAARDHAVTAGADDFLPKPVVPARLLQILAAPRKVRAVEAKRSQGSHPLTRAAAWSALPTSLAAVVGETLLMPTVPWDAPAAVSDEVKHLAMTSLIDTEHQLEMVAALSGSMADLERVTQVMLGEVASGAELVTATLTELVNILAGRMKTEFLREGYTFTLGIPSTWNRTDLASTIADSVASRTLVLRAGEVTLSAHICVRPSEAVDIPALELREGLVLASDVRNSSGGLILPACTRLTESAAQHLREMLRGRAVRVCGMPRSAAPAAASARR